MEAMVKKYQERFRKFKDEMDRWDDLQVRLISQFQNASSIIGRLEVSLSSDFNYTYLYLFFSLKIRIFENLLPVASRS